MAVLLDATDPRGPKAVELVIADEWRTYRDREGRRSYGIPSSQPSLYYRVTADGCTCPTLKYRPWVACKHMLALRLYLEMPDELMAEIYAV